MNVCAEKNQFRVGKSAFFLCIYVTHEQNLHALVTTITIDQGVTPLEYMAIKIFVIGVKVGQLSYSHQVYPVDTGQLSVQTRALDGAEQVLHFLHGNGFAVRTYSALLESLAEQSGMILQDAAGHGLSPAGEDFVGWEASSKRFQSVLEQLVQPQWHSLVGVGHSFGGCMTLLMSIRNPQLFEQTVLLDPALYPEEMIEQLMHANEQEKRQQSMLVRQTERRRTTWPSMQDACEQLRGRGTFVGWEERCLEDYVNFSTYETQTGERHLCCPPWLEAAVFGSAPEMLWRDIPKLKTPTYIVWGTQTLDVFQQSYQRIRQEGSDIRFVEVQGGHCFMMQYPTQSARLVRALIDQNVDEIRALQHSGFVINFDD